MENPQLPLNLVFPLARAHAHVEKTRIRQAIEDVIGGRLTSIEDKLTQQNQNQSNNDQREIDSLRGRNMAQMLDLSQKKAQITTLEAKANLLEGQAQRLQGELDECRATGTSTRQELAAKEAEIARVIATAESLNEGAQKLEDELESCRQQKLAGDNTLVEKEATILRLQEELAGAQAEYANCLREKDRLNSGNEELIDLRQQITAKENQLITLREENQLALENVLTSRDCETMDRENQSTLETAIVERDELRASLRDSESRLEQNQLSLQTVQLALTEALGSRNQVPGPVQEDLEEKLRTEAKKGEDCRKKLLLIQQQLTEKDAEIAALKESAKERLEYAQKMTKTWHDMFKNKEKKARTLEDQLEAAQAGREKLQQQLDTAKLDLAEAKEYEGILKKGYADEAQKTRILEQQLSEKDAEIATLKDGVTENETRHLQQLQMLRDEGPKSLETAELALSNKQKELEYKQKELDKARELLQQLWVSDEDLDQKKDKDSDSDEEKDVLFDSIVNQMRADLEECRDARDFMKKQLEAIKKDEFEELEGNDKSYQTEINADDIRELNAQAVAEATKSREELQKTVLQLQTMESEKKNLEVLKDDLEAQMENLRDEGTGLHEELAFKHTELGKMESENEVRQIEMARLREEVAEKKKSIDNMLGSVDENATKLLNAKETCEAALKEKSTKLEQALKQLEALETIHEDTRQQDALQDEVKQLKVKEFQLREVHEINLNICAKDKADLETKMKKTERELAAALETIDDRDGVIQRLDQVIEKLREQVRTMDPKDAAAYMAKVEECRRQIEGVQRRAEVAEGRKEGEIETKVNNGVAKVRAEIEREKNREISRLSEKVKQLEEKIKIRSAGTDFKSKVTEYNLDMDKSYNNIGRINDRIKEADRKKRNLENELQAKRRAERIRPLVQREVAKIEAHKGGQHTPSLQDILDSQSSTGSKMYMKWDSAKFLKGELFIRLNIKMTQDVVVGHEIDERMTEMIEILQSEEPKLRVLPDVYPIGSDVSTRKKFDRKVALVELKKTNIWPAFKKHEHLAKDDSKSKLVLFYFLLAKQGLNQGERTLLNAAEHLLPVLQRKRQPLAADPAKVPLPPDSGFNLSQMFLWM